jgi:CubicO group peptidase (beta-lactamase class C family)
METKALLSRLFGISILFLLISTSTIFAQTTDLQTRLTQLRHGLPQIMDSAEVPGLSIAVLEGDFVWQQGFGFKNAESQTLVKSQTVFEAASLSKPVFAYLVLKLAEKGRIDLDKPLVNYVSKETLERLFFKGPLLEVNANLITARIVLTHSTGFPNWRKPEEAIRLQFLPGSAYKYSGEGYMLLQLVVEQLMHRPLNKLARIYVFDPLGMQNSSFRWEPDFETMMAHGHDASGQVFAFRKPAQEAAAYSLFTTAEDYGKFMQALLTHDGLSDLTFADMFKPQISTGYGKEQQCSWGLGLGLQNVDQGKAFWHWGDNGIYKCFMMGIPEKKMGFVYFTNSANGLNMGEKIVEFLLDEHIPNFNHLGYDCYNSPALLLAKIMRDDGIVQGVRYYEDLKVKFDPQKPPLDEQALMRMGYQLLAGSKPEEAVELFKINVELHPSSWNAFDSLGEAYMLQGNDRLAIVNYERSLRLNPQNANGIKMLKKLRK